jgi:hypothetical protein
VPRGARRIKHGMNKKPTTNLWLDDQRECPYASGWHVAKNYDEAVQILSNYSVVNASLDHDLSWDPVLFTTAGKTGYDLVCWMEAHGCWPVYAPTVHSHNPAGARRMALVLGRHYGVRPEKLLKPYKNRW